MRRQVIIGILLVWSLQVRSQSSVNTFLAAPISDLEYKRAQASSAFAENHKFRSPWLREFDFRLRTNNTQLDVEEYRLRLGLLNPWEIRANQGYRSLVREKSSIDLLKAENEVLQRRFELLIEHYFLDRKAGLIAEQQDLLHAQWELYMNTPGDIASLIELKRTMAEVRLDSNEAIQKVAWLSDRIKAESGVELQWDNFELINPDMIMAVVNSLDITEDNLFEEEIQQELALEEQLLRVEKAEAFSNIGFVQAEYDMDRGNEDREQVGFQLGLQLPLFNTDRPDIERAKLSMVTERVNAAYAREEFTRRLQDFKSRLMMTYEQYQLVEKEKESLSELQALTSRSDVDLDAYLELADFKFYLENRKHALRSTLTSQYLNMLGFMGLFSRRPLINYLSAKMESFEWDE